MIHPSHIDACNAIFTPPAEEVAEARKIIAAFERPENASRGAIQLDGRMVERLHADMAKRTIAIADAIAAMDGLAPWRSQAGSECFAAISGFRALPIFRSPTHTDCRESAPGRRGLLAKYAAR